MVVYNSALEKTTTITQGVGLPTSVAIDRLGTVYIANSLSNSVTEYESPGYTQLPVTLTDGISNPTEVAIGAYDEVYVVNTSVGVSVFDGFGDYLYGGGSGTVTVVVTPPYIEFWSGSYTGTNRAQVDIGNPVSMAHFGLGFLAGSTYKSFTPTMAAANATNGDVWVTDDVDTLVVHLDQAGNVVGSFTPGSTPYGIAVDAARQRLFVGEAGASQVEVFNLKTLKRITVVK